MKRQLKQSDVILKFEGFEGGEDVLLDDVLLLFAKHDNPTRHDIQAKTGWEMDKVVRILSVLEKLGYIAPFYIHGLTVFGSYELTYRGRRRLPILKRGKMRGLLSRFMSIIKGV